LNRAVKEERWEKWESWESWESWEKWGEVLPTSRQKIFPCFSCLPSLANFLIFFNILGHGQFCSGFDNIESEPVVVLRQALCYR
jgi:hypothetical protein